MAKRLTDTDKWKDDWYVSLSNDYRIIWLWLLDNCNHAGICKRSIGLLNRDCNTSISEDVLIEKMDGRVLICDNNWFIPKFLRFQYPNLTSNKPVIVSAVKEIEKNNLTAMIPESFGNDYLIIKSKDKSKSKSKDSIIPVVVEPPEIKIEDPVTESTTPPINPFYSHEKNKELAEVDVGFTSAYYQWGLIGDKLPRWLEAFNRMLNHDGKTLKTKDDYRKHFGNWLKYQKYTTTEPEDYSPVGPPPKDAPKNDKPSPIKVADAQAIANKYG